MPPRMRTRSADRPTAKSLERGMGVRVGRCGRGRRPREGNDERVDDLNSQGNNQGMGANGGVEGANRGAPDFSTIIENVGNVFVNGNQVGCSYREFLACNPKEYDGKEGVVVLTRWIEKMENVQDMSGCSMDQKVKYTTGSFVEEFCPIHEMQKLETELWNHAIVEAGHDAYTDRFHELERLVPYLVTLESIMIKRYVYGLAPQIRRMVAAMEPKTIQKAVQILGVLTDEAVRNRSIKKVEKRGNVGEPNKDKSGRDDKKRTRTGNICVATMNRVGRENTGVPRNVNPVNPKNLPVRACYECGSTDHVRSACPRWNRAKGLGEPSKLSIEPSELGFRYKIEIASGHLVKIYKVVRIPLSDGKVVRVLGERPKEKARLLMSTKASDKKQVEIVVAIDFPEVFLDDLSGLPPIQEIKF
nr:hypothetical protein [Tanacetum cinerariifolium]